jgi:hypothetical protein
MAEVQSDRFGEPLRYPAPVQGGSEKVTRQVGLAPTAPPGGFDPAQAHLQPVIQGSHEIHTTRQAGNGAQHFDASGTLRADSVADDHSILYVDDGTAAGGANPPPGLARTNAPIAPRSSTFGEMAAVEQRAAIKAQAEAMGFVVSDRPVEVKDSPSAFAVIASDDGAHDPRDKGDKGPMVFTADALPVVKKRAIVPVVLPTPERRRVKAKAAPKGGK